MDALRGNDCPTLNAAGGHVCNEADAIAVGSVVLEIGGCFDDALAERLACAISVWPQYEIVPMRLWHGRSFDYARMRQELHFREIVRRELQVGSGQAACFLRHSLQGRHRAHSALIGTKRGDLFKNIGPRQTRQRRCGWNTCAVDQMTAAASLHDRLVSGADDL